MSSKLPLCSELSLRNSDRSSMHGLTALSSDLGQRFMGNMMTYVHFTCIGFRKAYSRNRSVPSLGKC